MRSTCAVWQRWVHGEARHLHMRPERLVVGQPVEYLEEHVADLLLRTLHAARAWAVSAKAAPVYTGLESCRGVPLRIAAALRREAQ